MKLLKRILGWRSRGDWVWAPKRQRPTLLLDHPPRPGWYMLTVRLESDQLRCYGLFNGCQGRVLISGKRRRRLVHIGTTYATTHFQLLGLNGNPRIVELRLVPQPLFRVRRLVVRKLLKLHPAYRDGFERQRNFVQRWHDYNRVLSGRNFSLIGYDDWIERVERPLLQRNLEQCDNGIKETTSESAVVNFAIWIWGERNNEELCQRSLSSLANQLPGAFKVLEPDHQLQEKEANTWLIALRAGDQLAPQALQHFSLLIHNHAEACICYSDQDFISHEGRRHSPQFKPSWNPDLLYSDPHYLHSWVMRSDRCFLACRVLADQDQTPDLYGIALEATASCQADQIFHLPEVLYYEYDGASHPTATSHTAEILQAFLKRHNQSAQVSLHAGVGHVLHWSLPDPPPLVSLIIPTRDQGDLLRCCIHSMDEHNHDNPPTELILVDNGTREQSALDYLAEVEQRDNVRILRRPGPFNYAALNNEAVSLAKGELVALMNNDVEVTHSGWLASLAAQALRPEIGAVGAKLLFTDGTIQHGGVILGIGGVAGHAHKYFDGRATGYQRRLKLVHNLSAVTGAMLVVRKKLFQEVGGFDAEKFAVNYNDVDFCLRLIMAGYRNLFCPDVILIHHESKSRGAPVSGDAHAQWQSERQAMLERWGSVLAADPHYSPHLSLQTENLSLSLKASSNEPRTSIPVVQ